MPSTVFRKSLPSVSVLFALLVAAGFAMVLYLDAPLWFPGVFAISVVLVQYVVNPWIIQWLVPAQVIADKTFAGDHPVVQLVQQRCGDAGIPMVKLGIVDDGAPNAFTFGRTRGDARIWLTRGLVERLDESELDAVVTHEIGHIKHRDFIVMTIAAVVPMVLYLVYVTARTDRKRGLPVAVAAYIGYILAQFSLLALSRARERAADQWSCACTGNGDALASALVKIAYGMGVAHAEAKERALALARGGKDEQKVGARIGTQTRRTQSMRALGIFEPRAAEAMAAAFAGGVDPQRAVAAMRWDLANPWARVLELAGSHPLVARRIESLGRSGLPGAPQTWSALLASATPEPEERARARTRFAGEVAIMLAPYAVFVPLLLFGAFRGSGLTVGLALVAGGALLLYKQTVRFPGEFEPVDEIASLLGRTEAGPMAGIPVSITGQVAGRGMPGYVLSPDLVVADDTGFVTLLYRQPVPLLATLFGLFRAGDFMGDRVVARGWYRRVPGPVIELGTCDA